MNDLHDLELLLRSRVPLITVETRDERRVARLFSRLGIRLGQPVMSWSTTAGLQRVDIELTQAAWDALWVDPESKQTVRADTVVFGERLSDVGFRMRGQFSLRESGDKKPWKIDTDSYVDGQEYRNLKQLMFINNIGDPTMVRPANVVVRQVARKRPRWNR